MASILKVDTLQKPDGSTPTAADLGLDVSGSVRLIGTKRTSDYITYNHPDTDTWQTHASLNVNTISDSSMLMVRGYYVIRTVNSTNLRFVTRLLVDGVSVGDTAGESADLSGRTYFWDNVDRILTQPVSYLVPASLVSSSTMDLSFQVNDGTGTATDFNVSQMAIEVYEIAQ
jgi:hypothetical protein